MKAYRLADNKTAELAEWDDTLLLQEIAELQKLDIDIDVLGFSAEELTDLFQTDLKPGQADPDAVPARPTPP